ncbi:hypothetical protein D018_1697B, partial [Vibrio parahaemolyticus VP2007-007]
KRGKLRSVCHH